MTDYTRLYRKIDRIMGTLTPLRADCGALCDRACCKGDDCTGMRLFPGEQTRLRVRETDDGGRLAVCDGSCERAERPLACKIFPFFPTVDERGRVFGGGYPRRAPVPHDRQLGQNSLRQAVFPRPQACGQTAGSGWGMSGVFARCHRRDRHLQGAFAPT